MHKFLNSTRAKRKRENSGITESYSKLTERELHEKTIEMHMDLINVTYIHLFIFWESELKDKKKYRSKMIFYY